MCTEKKVIAGKTFACVLTVHADPNRHYLQKVKR